jgi:hypothetical protein
VPTASRARPTDWPFIVFRLSALVVPFVAALTVGSGEPASAANFDVSSSADSGSGTLRQAVLDANASPGDDTVGFAAALSGQTITLTSGALVANAPGDALTVSGSSLPAPVEVSGADAQSLLDVVAGTVTIDRLTLRDGLGSVGANGPDQVGSTAAGGGQREAERSS